MGRFFLDSGAESCFACPTGTIAVRSGWSTPCVTCPPNAVTSDNHQECICSRQTYKVTLPHGQQPAHLSPGELASTPQEGLDAVSFECRACLDNAVCQDNLIANAQDAWVYVDKQQGGAATVFSCPDGYCLPNNTCAPGRKPDFKENILCGECLENYSEWSGACGLGALCAVPVVATDPVLTCPQARVCTARRRTLASFCSSSSSHGATSW